MPEMDGYEATRQIRNRERGGACIPITALTAHAIKGADAECIAVGMDACLTKPIDRALLEAMLMRFRRRVLRHGRSAASRPLDLRKLVAAADFSRS